MTKRRLIGGMGSVVLMATCFVLAPMVMKPQGKIVAPPGSKPIVLPNTPAPSASPAPPEDPIHVDIRQDVTYVTAPVSVYDKNRNFVNGLTVLDFQLLDKGIPQVVTQDVQAHPISLVVVVQANSTSQQVLPTIQKSSSLFGDLVAGESGEVAVVGFDHEVKVLTGFTSDGALIKAAFGKLKAGSQQSHLDDASMAGIRMLKSRGRERKKVLLIISETRDVGSAVTARDVLTEAEFADVVIHTVEMNHMINQLTTQAPPNRPNPVPPEARTPLPMGTMQTGTTDAQTNMGNVTPVFKEIFTAVKGIFIPNSLEVFTKFTGGKEHSFLTQGGLEEAVQAIGQEIHSQYLLTYLPSNRLDAGYHEITVSLPRINGMEVRTRAGYWIAPQN